MEWTTFQLRFKTNLSSVTPYGRINRLMNDLNEHYALEGNLREIRQGSVFAIIGGATSKEWGIL